MNLRTLICVFGIGFLVSVIAGCSESSEAKAAKEARQQAEKAAAMVEDYKLDAGYDYATAKEVVDKAVALANKAGGQADGVYFASADLTTAYASKQEKVLSASQESVSEQLQACIKIASRLSECQSQLDSIEMLMGTGEQEAKSLKELLNSEQQGIKSKLQESKKMLDALEVKLASYNDAADLAKKAADAIQLKADKMLREAQLLVGHSRIELERKAYAILKGEDGNDKSVFYYQKLLQENLDLAAAVEVQINTIKPSIPKLEEDIESVGKRISELVNQDKTLDFSGQLATLKTQYQQFKTELETKFENLKTQFGAYNEEVVQQVALYVDAQENYAKVKTDGLKENAQLKIADCRKAVALVNVKTADFINRISGSVITVADVQLNKANDKIQEMAGKLDALSAEYSEKAKSAFDSAFEQYQNVIDRYSDGEFADVAVRNYMTAIYEGLSSEVIGEQMADSKEALLAKVNEMKSISIQVDPKFGNSKVAGLFGSYGIEFKTAEQKLQEKYLDLKVKFAACQDLTGENKQDEILSLLEDFNSLDSLQDEQFYKDLVKYLYEMFRDDWIAIYEMEPESDKLSVFTEFLAQDTEPEETYEESDDRDSNDPNS